MEKTIMKTIEDEDKDKEQRNTGALDIRLSVMCSAI
jgi:hypothetical protein